MPADDPDAGVRQVVVSSLSWLNKRDLTGEVGEAVERLLEKIDAIPEDRDARARLRAEISTAFGLWGANLDLLRSCGFEFMCADYATDLIVARAREELERRTRLVN